MNSELGKPAGEGEAARAEAARADALLAARAASAAAALAACAGRARALGYDLDAHALALLERYRVLLAAANERVALTRLDDSEAFFARGVLDALALTRAFDAEGPPPLRIVDVGSGGGLPAVPLAITLPHHARYRAANLAPAVCALEPIGKKARALEEIAAALGLTTDLARGLDEEPLRKAEARPFTTRFTVLAERSEDAARRPGLRDAFDLATCRALAELRVALELTLPLIRPGGLFIAYKGPRADDEVAAAGAALTALAGVVEAIIPAAIPGHDLVLVKVRKTGPTPARYPRRAGVPAKRPL